MILGYDEVTSSGNYSIGATAVELGMVDHLVISDIYINERVRAGDRVVKLVKHQKRGVAGEIIWILSSILGKFNLCVLVVAKIVASL